VCPWIDVPREGGELLTKQPLVTLRPNTLAFNSPFVRMAELKKHRFVSLKVDPDNLRIGLRFHDDSQDHTALTLTHDGGGAGHKRRERNNLSVMTSALMRRNPWIMAAAKEPDLSLRRFVPEWTGIDKLWVITLRPTHDRRVSAIDDVPLDARGIYRYVDRGEIVYIGKGNIRERLRCRERDGWEWDHIEYSVIDAEPQQFKWESWWLDWFERKNGSLPRYNRIGGRDT